MDGTIGGRTVIRNGCHYVFALALACPLAAGCAGFWDSVTSRDFRIKNVVVPPEPMAVLRESNDGDARAKAFRRLREPNRSGGSDKEQDEALQHLSYAATTDNRPLVKLAAIETLGRFSDPRAGSILMSAYHQSSSLPGDQAATVRGQALRAMGENRNPQTLALLMDAARSPAVEPAKSFDMTQARFESSLPTRNAGPLDLDPSALREMRIAAITSIGQFRDPMAIPMLIGLLGEKDVAIRDRAHEALQLITKRTDIPPDAERWKTATQSTTIPRRK
jgi:HEAT repeat protein